MKNMKNDECTLQDLEYGKITENVEKEKHTLQDVKCGEENSKSWKIRNVHGRTWNMARKLKIMENEKHTLED